MIINLVKKDFLLIKKYVLIAAVIGFVVPILLYINMDKESPLASIYQLIIFVLVMFVLVLFLSNSVSLAEETGKKGCAFLLTAPYDRNEMVISKYVFSYIAILLYTMVYMASHMCFPQYTMEMTPYTFIYSAAFVLMFRLVLIPLEFKFGYENAKYIVTFLTIGIPFLLSAVSKKVDITNINLRSLHTVKALLFVIISLFVISLVSCAISCAIFKRKEL